MALHTSLLKPPATIAIYTSLSILQKYPATASSTALNGIIMMTAFWQRNFTHFLRTCLPNKTCLQTNCLPMSRIQVSTCQSHSAHLNRMPSSMRLTSSQRRTPIGIEAQTRKTKSNRTLYEYITNCCHNSLLCTRIVDQSIFHGTK